MGIFDVFRRKKISGGIINRRLAYDVGALLGASDVKNSEVIFAAVSRIATTLGSAPCTLYHGATPDTSPGVGDLIRVMPNPNMTPFEFFRTMEVCRNGYGNGYALKIPNAQGGLIRIDVIDPERVTPMIEQDSQELWYQVSLPTGMMIYVPCHDMIHVKHISNDGIRGIRPSDVLRGTLDYAASIAKFSLEHVRNGVHASLVLDFPSELSQTKKQDAINQFLQAYASSNGALIALDAGVRATRMDGSMVDPKLLDVDKMTRGRVAAVYNLPPHLLGDYSSSGYNSNEQQMIEFLTLTMTPITAQYAQELNRKLLTADQVRAGYGFKFDLSCLLQADSATRAEYYSKMIRSTGMTSNEIRAREGLPPKPGGDQLLSSRDLVPLDMLGQIPTPAAPAAQPASGGRT